MRTAGGYWRQQAGCMVVALAVAGCATTGTPVGGPKDVQGPVVVAVDPANETTGFDARVIRISFDEFLRQGDASKAVFLSPVPPRLPNTYVFNKQLFIELEPSLLEPDVTYVLTLGRALVDDNEGNPIPRPVQYAFTRGTRIDQGVAGGRVVNPLTGQGVLSVFAGLYDADSVRLRGLRGLRPRYLAPTDSNGYFELAYMRPGTYYLFGFSDDDASFSYTGGRELAALDTTRSVTVREDEPVAGLQLQAFPVDTLGPRLAGVEVVNAHNAVISFDEGLTAVGLAFDSARRSSLQPAVQAAADLAKAKNDPRALWLHSPWPLADSVTLVVRGATDSLGNVARDTTLRLFVPARQLDTALVATQLSETVPQDIFRFRFQLSGRIPPDTLRARARVVDSNLAPLPAQVLPADNGYDLVVQVPPDIDADIRPAILIDSTLRSPEGLPLPGGYYLPLPLQAANNFGAVQGRLQTSRRDLVVQLVSADGQRVYQSRGATFQFPYVQPGQYRFRVIEDADGNGIWTTGTIEPPRLPEPVHLYGEVLNVRPGWDLTGVDLPFPPAQSGWPKLDASRPGSAPVPGAAAGQRRGRQ